jgi:hypothetical protein
MRLRPTPAPAPDEPAEIWLGYAVCVQGFGPSAIGAMKGEFVPLNDRRVRTHPEFFRALAELPEAE